MDLGDWLINARNLIRSLPDTSSASLNSIIGFVIKKPLHFGYSHPEFNLSKHEEETLNSLLNRLISDEPLPYLIGKQDFFQLEIKVSADVLIPRPETEVMVENILNDIAKQEKKFQIADIGTGSGCISIAIGKNHASSQIYASDISECALRIAQININQHDLKQRIKLFQADLLTCFNCQFDYICANLPYIPSDVLKDLTVSKFEPLSALDGGKDGLVFIKRLLAQSVNRIKPDGKIFLEIEANQSIHVKNLALSYFPTSEFEIIKDLSGLPRLAIIKP